MLGNKKDVRIVGYGMIDSVKLAAAKQGLLLALVVEKVSTLTWHLYLSYISLS